MTKRPADEFVITGCGIDALHGACLLFRARRIVGEPFTTTIALLTELSEPDLRAGTKPGLSVTFGKHEWKIQDRSVADSVGRSRNRILVAAKREKPIVRRKR